MRLLGDVSIRYISGHEPGWKKEAFFVPDYSERDLKKYDGRHILIELDDFYVPTTLKK